MFMRFNFYLHFFSSRLVMARCTVVSGTDLCSQDLSTGYFFESFKGGIENIR